MKPYRSGVRHDYKDVYTALPAPRRQRRWSLFLLGLSLPLITVALLLTSERNESKLPEPTTAGGALEEIALEVPPRLGVLADRPAAATPAAPPDVNASTEPLDVVASTELPYVPYGPAVPTTVLELIVEPGDSLERLFRRHDLRLSDLAEMVRLDEIADHLKLLKPGDKIRVEHLNGRVMSMLRQLDRVRMLSIARAESGFDAETIELPLERREIAVHGEIRSSLFEAGSAAGISDALIMSMDGIFRWDIDFLQDVRVGDTFTLIYEEHWRDGERLGDGPIVAAEFINQGKTFRAARYVDPTGRADYFTPEGRSVRKAFLRAPLSFTRISSNFDLNRRHPVLNTIRAHRGVDYAAPTGTPVQAAGDGKIISRGPDGGYGNAVVVQHGGNITTLYAHLSRFGRQQVGSRVSQGDIIGYVGATGLATGPHLHYEYRVNGVHRNPRTVALPPADPVPADYRADFEVSTASLWERLDAAQPARYTTAANR